MGTKNNLYKHKCELCKVLMEQVNVIMNLYIQ